MLSEREFAEYIAAHIAEFMPETFGGAEITVEETVKMNDDVRIYLAVRKEGEAAYPQIPVEAYYADYLNGESLDEILGQMVEVRIRHAVKQDRTDELLNMIKDYDSVKDAIHGRLVDPDLNKRSLEKLVSRPCGDFALTYQIDIGAMSDNDRSEYIVRVTKNNLKQWGVTEDDLYRDALAADKKREPALYTMTDIMIDLQSEMLGMGYTAENYLIGDKTLPDDLEPPMFIMTYKDRAFGASILAQPDVLEKVGELLGENYFVIPSSIQECIIMRESDANAQVLSQMCREINANEVKRDELLSDKVQHYDIMSKKLENALSWDTERQKSMEQHPGRTNRRRGR